MDSVSLCGNRCQKLKGLRFFPACNLRSEPAIVSWMPKQISGSVARDKGLHYSWYSCQYGLHVCTSSPKSNRSDTEVGPGRCCTHSGFASQVRSPEQTKQNFLKGSCQQTCPAFAPKGDDAFIILESKEVVAISYLLRLSAKQFQGQGEASEVPMA